MKSIDFKSGKNKVFLDLKTSERLISTLGLEKFINFLNSFDVVITDDSETEKSLKKLYKKKI